MTTSCDNMEHVMLDHPKLGRLRGTKKNGVNQYLGVKFASLKDRFSRGELLCEPRPVAGHIDATKYGYEHNRGMATCIFPNIWP